MAGMKVSTKQWLKNNVPEFNNTNTQKPEDDYETEYT
jgi:hypothetical protein